MQGIVFRSGGQVSLEGLTDPRPKAGEVLLRVRASGICHTDIEILRGNYGSGAFPLVPGHEFAGDVVETGPEVTGFAAGDRVVVDPNLGCGACRACQAGRINLCEALGAYGVTTNGGFAEYCVVRTEKLYPVGGLSFAVAALAEPMGCVLNGLSPLEGRQIDRSLVFGAGPIGMLMALALRARGAKEVGVVDMNAERLAIAESFGLTAIATGSASLAGLEKGCDLAVDATGVPNVAERLLTYISNGGSALFFGVCPPSARIEISPFEIFRRQLSIFGTHSLNLGHIPAALAVLKQIGPQIERLITHQLTLEGIAETFSGRQPTGAMKVQLSL